MRAGLGPAPSRPPAPVAGLPSRAAAGILDLLAQQSRPMTAAALAEQSGQHSNTVREHLDVLVEHGLATRERAEAAGRGRPAWLYAVAREEHPASMPPAVTRPEPTSVVQSRGLAPSHTSDFRLVMNHRRFTHQSVPPESSSSRQSDARIRR